MNKQFFRVVVALIFGLGLTPLAQAQWQTQTNVVSPGWTAIYLYVDASSQPILPSTAGQPITPANPIDKIWLWKAPATTAQYISSPESPLNAGGPWVDWGITNSQNSLGALIPNAAYLIHSSATTNYTWKIKGRPVPPLYTWDLTGLNFLGFSTPAANPPNFQNFFAQAPAIGDVVQVYQYAGGDLSASNPALVVRPQITPVTRGAAWWVSATNVNNTYFGPFSVNLPNSSGLSFGTNGGQLTFHLVNMSQTNLTVTMSVLASETPPVGQTLIIAPPPLLLEGALNASNLTYAYTALATNGTSQATNAVAWTLPPYGQSGSDVAITLGVNRYAMTNNAGSLYAGILQFTDSLGFSDVNIPVSATAANTAGLWVGSASVSQVSYDLKTYATNAAGALVVSAVTNEVVTTNILSVGTTTNLAINFTSTTNTTIDYYNLTNLVINTYTTNTYLTATNAMVVSTNTLFNFVVTSEVIITTTPTGYYFTNGGSLLVWITANTTNGPILTTTATGTNLFFTTNFIATVPANGMLEAVTNSTVSTYSDVSEVVTNGIFLAQVTNEVVTSSSVTNVTPGTAPAYNVVTTNLLTFSYAVTNGPTGTNYVVTNAPVAGGLPPVTNYFPTPAPLEAFTNGAMVTVINVVTNNYALSTSLNPVFLTNFVTISNNFVLSAGTTNLTGSSTNVVSAAFPAPGSGTSTNYSVLSLAVSTVPAYLVVTNPLVSSVSNYVVTAHNTSLDAVAAPYPLRLIVFNGTNGSCCLLQRVYYGLRQNTNLVVATTESVLDVAHLNVARRITATQLPWSATNNPFYFTGGSLAQGATLTTTVTDQYDDQTSNPFLHTYHPDHDNLDFSYAPPHELPPGSQSYTISRVIQLSVTPNATDFLSLTTADTALAGTYHETMTLYGLGGAAKTYQTAGTFTLKQISPIPVLTTQ